MAMHMQRQINEIKDVLRKYSKKDTDINFDDLDNLQSIIGDYNKIAAFSGMMKEYILKNIGRLRGKATEYLGKIQDLENSLSTSDLRLPSGLQERHIEARALKGGSYVAEEAFTREEICSKYNISNALFYIQSKKFNLKKTKDWPRKYFITPEIHQLLLNKKDGKKQDSVAYDSDSKPMPLDNINLENGAYLTQNQISRYFGISEATIYKRLNEHKFKTMKLDGKSRKHYLITNENKNLFARKRGIRNTAERTERISASSRIDTKSKVYDFDKNPIDIKDINIEKGAYLTQSQISRYTGCAMQTVTKRLKENKENVQAAHIGTKMQRHYLINSSNLGLFEKRYGRGWSKYKGPPIKEGFAEGLVSFYSLCEELGMTEEELFKKSEEMRIELLQPSDKNSTTALSLADANRLRKHCAK